jgi:GNAT superfamily N-acetyltransferase
MTELEIRFATVDDTPAILGLIRELAEYERLSDEVTADERTLRASLFEGRPVAEVLLGILDGAPVGYALYFHNYSTFTGRPGLYLEDIYVKPECRGRGFGTLLLKAAARIAVERKCARFDWTVLDWNEPAIAFYRNLGALPLEDWTIYRLEDEALERLARDGPTIRKSGS